jgi:hypothetical protein
MESMGMPAEPTGGSMDEQKMPAHEQKMPAHEGMGGTDGMPAP